MQHRYLCLPHTDYLRAHGTWEHTDLKAVRPKTEESHKRKCQHIRSLGKQADGAGVWGPDLKLTGSHPVQITRGNTTNLLSFLSLSDQEMFLNHFRQHFQ